MWSRGKAGDNFKGLPIATMEGVALVTEYRMSNTGGGLMKTHYYLGWFSNFFPENLGRALQDDITDRKSLVMISSNPSIYEEDGATDARGLNRLALCLMNII